MLRRVRRPALLVLPAVLLTALAGCGSDDGNEDALDGFDAVTVSGDFGSAPKVEWEGEMDADDVETKVLVEGDGPEVQDGEKVDVNVWIGNGFTQEEAYSTYDKGGSPETFTLDDQLSPLFKDALEGQTIGSRIAVTAPSSEAFGEGGNPQMDIGNEDSVLFVLDLMELFQPPEPKDVPPARLPGVVQDKGEPTALDFEGLPKPRPDGDEWKVNSVSAYRTSRRLMEGHVLVPDERLNELNPSRDETVMATRR